MQYLFTESGKRRLSELARPSTLFAFDFDGTLSKIVRQHQEAQLTAPIRTRLVALAKLAPTAILSGRSIADLRTRVDGAVAHLVGNHGLEGLCASPEALQQARNTCAAWTKQVEERFLPLFKQIGVTMEDKTYSLAIHYRTVRWKPAAKHAVRQLLPLLSPPPRVLPGKSVLNLVPPDAPHKGTALLDLMNRLGCAAGLYIGDDETDEDVFGLDDPRVMTVRVGKTQSSRAQFYVKRQSEVVSAVAYLVRRLKRVSALGKDAGGV